jgi:hypothetical protein
MPDNLDEAFGKLNKVEYLRLNNKPPNDEPKLLGKKNEYWLPIEVAVLHIQPIRTLWSKDDSQPEKGQKPLCKSEDAVTGSKFGECKKCEFSVWVDRRKPPCRSGWETWLVPMNELDADNPLKVFRLERSAWECGRDLVSMVKGRIPFEKIFTISAHRPEKGNKTYWIPTFEEGRDTTTDERTTLEALQLVAIGDNGYVADKQESEDTNLGEPDIPDSVVEDKGPAIEEKPEVETDVEFA